MNKNLDSVEWREFVLGEIFKINSTIDGIDKNKLNGTQGIFPYITRTDKQNGIDDFIGNQELYRLNFKGCISVGLDTQTAFWQENEFYTGQNIQIISNDKLNKYNALFFIVQIKNLMKIFSWGGTGATLTRLRRSKILLPTDSQGQPNYDFMEKFMRQIEQRHIKNQLKTIKSKLTQSTQCTFDTNAIKWKEFKISDIFKVFGTTTTHPSKLQPNGTTPRITCATTNNGLDNVYANEPTENGGVLTIDSATTAYIGYQEKDFIATDHVEKVIMKNSQRMNRYVGLFIKQCIDKACIIDENMQTKKYLYGYKFSQTRIKRQIIKLPIDSNGNPHYAFMESTMRKLEQKHLRSVFAYFGVKANGNAT